MKILYLVALVLGTCGVIDADASDSIFEKPKYRIAFPESWIDISKPGLNSFKSRDGTRGLTTTSFSAKRPWTKEELEILLRKLADAQVEAGRRTYGSAMLFESPEFSNSGKYTYVRMWGLVPGEIGNLLIGDSFRVESFTYTSTDMAVSTFRSEAEKIFQSIELK